MAVTQKAIGVAWGLGTGFACTGVATVLKVSGLQASFNRSAQMVELPDLNGEAKGLVFWNKVDEVDLRVYPSDTTLAASVTAGGSFGMGAGNTLNPGDKFVITDTDDPDLAGTYLVIKIGKTRKAGAYVEFDISIKRWPTDLSTTTA